MPISINNTTLTFNDATTQTTAGITSAVTSASGGNGISVSGPTGAVTFSIAAPGFNTVGSYCQMTIRAGQNQTITTGDTYAAGFSNLQVNPSAISDSGGGLGIGQTSSLSGTWRWMGAGGFGGSFYGNFLNCVAIGVRVS